MFWESWCSGFDKNKKIKTTRPKEKETKPKFTLKLYPFLKVQMETRNKV